MVDANLQKAFFLPSVCTPTVSNRVFGRHGVPACVGPRSKHCRTIVAACLILCPRRLSQKTSMLSAFQNYIEYSMTSLANLWTVHGIPRSAAQRGNSGSRHPLYTWHIMPTSRKCACDLCERPRVLHNVLKKTHVEYCQRMLKSPKRRVEFCFIA